jgi:hypothetical protein
LPGVRQVPEVGKGQLTAQRKSLFWNVLQNSLFEIKDFETNAAANREKSALSALESKFYA